ncbi:MAG: hypothetical protein AAFW87_00860 [Pseudomonadota bacterium]
MNVEFNDRAIAQSVVGFRAINVWITKDDNQFQGSASSSSGADPTVEAECTIKAKGYSAKFTSPAVVNMPSFGKETTSAKLNCNYAGTTISETLQPKNLSQGSRTGNAIAVGVLLCPVCGTAMAVGGAAEKDGDVYGFEDKTLKLK